MRIPTQDVCFLLVTCLVILLIIVSASSEAHAFNHSLRGESITYHHKFERKKELSQKPVAVSEPATLFLLSSSVVLLAAARKYYK